MSTSFIEVKNLEKVYAAKASFLNRKPERVIAVDNVSFSIKRGEAFGLVGESGSGKSTIGKSLLRLHEITAGSVTYKDQDIHELSKKRHAPFTP